MDNELRMRKISFFSAAYLTNVNYFIMLILLSFHVVVDKNIYLTLTIFGVPALLSTITSYFIIRRNLLYNLPREQGLLRLAIAHIPSLLGLTAAFIYLFVL